MTNIIRQLLMSTYDVHALLEAVCCNGYLGYILIRGEFKIDEVGEDHVDGAVGSMEKDEMHKLGKPIAADCSRQLPTPPDCSRLQPDCSRLLPTAANCSRLLPTAPDRSPLLPTVLDCSRLLQTA